jgi:hypothetical protein
MLTALDQSKNAILAVPDFEAGAGLGLLRERTRLGELVCPTCRQLLWLHAGHILIPHFAHRRLSDCPHGRVSEAILAARRSVYRFFQVRIESGKLPAEIQLEPVLPEMPKGVCLDLMLRRQTRPWVALVLIESNLKPDFRSSLPGILARQKWLFRPVFLSARLKRTEEDERYFPLDPTQREFRLASPYDMRRPGGWVGEGTLHFMDAGAAAWTTLRGASLVHDPQVFQARSLRASTMDQLLWSEVHSEWVHPGEAEELKAFREALAAEQRQRAAAKRAALREPVHAIKQAASSPRPSPPEEEREKHSASGPSRLSPDISEIAEPAEETVESGASVPPAAEPEPLPAWLSQGLVCAGCGKRTNDWQNADPAKDRCVCRECFNAGVRLP